VITTQTMHLDCHPELRYDLFVAVSYRGACSDSRYRHQLESLVEKAAANGIRVYVAPLLEAWGQQRPPRATGIARDLLALRAARGLMLFLAGHSSDGALVETGIALGWGKPLFLLRDSVDEDLGYLQGLVDTGYARLVPFGPEDELNSIVTYISRGI